MFALNLYQANESDERSHVGGGAWLPESLDWPLTSRGEPMRPLLTINQDIFVIPTIPENMAVTVFSPIDPKGKDIINTTRECAINDNKQINLDNKNGMLVYLHDKEKKEISVKNLSTYPKAIIQRRKFTEDEMAEDLIDDINGVYISKVLGRPSWLQDEIFFPPKFTFSLQVTEDDLVNFNKEYDGIFRGGSCYLFLRIDIKKLKSGDVAGICFIQFT